MEGDIRVFEDNTYVSRKHLTIRKSGDGFVIKDISTNGTSLGRTLPQINENELVREVGNGGREVNKNYIKASRELRAYFNDAIESGRYAADPETYIKTINEAHKVAYGGFDGKSTWYKQAGQGHIEIHPGEIRGEGAMRNGRIKEAGIVEQIAKRYGDPYRVSNNFQRVDLEGIPKKYQPQDTNINGYSHTYPDGVSLERYYYPQMQRTANEALELIKNNAPKDEIIKKIGQHYQYAANARPYGQINNSLFMNEVNTLLTKAGLKTMPHGMLDHA